MWHRHIRRACSDGFEAFDSSVSVQQVALKVNALRGDILFDLGVWTGTQTHTHTHTHTHQHMHVQMCA